MPAIVPPTGGCFAPTFTTGPGWHAAARTAEVSNIQLKRIATSRWDECKGQARLRNGGSGFGLRGQSPLVQRMKMKYGILASLSNRRDRRRSSSVAAGSLK